MGGDFWTTLLRSIGMRSRVVRLEAARPTRRPLKEEEACLSQTPPSPRSEAPIVREANVYTIELAIDFGE